MWEWDDEEKLYRNIETGELVSLDVLIERRNQLADESDIYYTQVPETEPEIEDFMIVALLLFGLISLAEWEGRMREAIKAVFTAQWILGRGGAELMSDEDWSRLEGELVKQYSFLSALAAQIAEGLLSEAEIAHYSGLYFSDSVIAFSQGRQIVFDTRFFLPVHPGDCTSECCANDRCYWDIQEFDDRITAKWVRTVIESCPTCIRRADCPEVVFIKETGEHQNLNCYL